MNAGKDQAILILPQRSGIYTLQLVARNVRGVVISSNQMRVIVEEIAGVKPATSGHKPSAPPTEMKKSSSAPRFEDPQGVTHPNSEEEQYSDSESDSNSEETRHSDSEPNSTPRSRSASTAHGNSRANRRHAGVHDLTQFKQPETLEEAYNLLGGVPSDTLEHTRKARNALARRFHGDKSAHRGDSPATQKLNEAKMKTVNAAYEMIENHKSPEDPPA